MSGGEVFDSADILEADDEVSLFQDITQTEDLNDFISSSYHTSTRSVTQLRSLSDGEKPEKDSFSDWSDMSDPDTDSTGYPKSAAALSSRYSTILKSMLDGGSEEKQRSPRAFDPKWRILDGIPLFSSTEPESEGSSAYSESMRSHIAKSRDLRMLLLSTINRGRLSESSPLTENSPSGYFSQIFARMNLQMLESARELMSSLCREISVNPGLVREFDTFSSIEYAVEFLKLAITLDWTEFLGDTCGLWKFFEEADGDTEFVKFYKSVTRRHVEIISECHADSDTELENLVSLLDACLYYERKDEEHLWGLAIPILCTVHEYLAGLDPAFSYFVPREYQGDFEALALQEFEMSSLRMEGYRSSSVNYSHEMTSKLVTDLRFRLSFFSTKLGESSVPVSSRIKIATYVAADRFLAGKELDNFDVLKISDHIIRGTYLFLQYEKVLLRMFLQQQEHGLVEAMLSKSSMEFNMFRDALYASFLREVGDELKARKKWKLTLTVFEFLLDKELEEKPHQGTVFLILTILQESLYAWGKFQKLLSVSEKVYRHTKSTPSTYHVKSKLYLAKAISHSLYPDMAISIAKDIIKGLTGSEGPQSTQFKLEALLLAAKVYYKLRDTQWAKDFLVTFQKFFVPKANTTLSKVVEDNWGYFYLFARVHRREGNYSDSLFWISVLLQGTSKSNFGRMGRLKYLEGKILAKILAKNHTYPVEYAFNTNKRTILGFEVPLSLSEMSNKYKFESFGQLLERTVKCFTSSLSYYKSISSAYKSAKVRTRISEVVLSYLFTHSVYHGVAVRDAIEVAAPESDLRRILDVQFLMKKTVDNLNSCSEMKSPVLTMENLLCYAKIQYLRGDITLSMKSWCEVQNVLHALYISGLTEHSFESAPIKHTLKLFKILKESLLLLFSYPWFFINDNLVAIDTYIKLQRLIEIKFLHERPSEPSQESEDYWGLLHRLRRRLKRYKPGATRHYVFIRELAERNLRSERNTAATRVAGELASKYQKYQKRKTRRPNVLTRKPDKMDRESYLNAIRKVYNKFVFNFPVDSYSWWSSKGISYDSLLYLNREKAEKLVFIIHLVNFIIYYSPRLRRRMIVPISHVQGASEMGKGATHAQVVDTHDSQAFFNYFGNAKVSEGPLLDEHHRVFRTSSIKEPMHDLGCGKWLDDLISRASSKSLSQNSIRVMRQRLGNPESISPSRFTNATGSSSRKSSRHNNGNRPGTIKIRLGLGSRKSFEDHPMPSILLVLGKWVDVLPWDALFGEMTLRYFSYFDVLEDENHLSKRHRTHSYFRYISYSPGHGQHTEKRVATKSSGFGFNEPWVKDFLATLTVSRLLNTCEPAEIPERFKKQISKAYRLRSEYFESPIQKLNLKPNRALRPMDWDRSLGDVLIIGFADLVHESWRMTRVLSRIGKEKPTLLVIPEEKYKVVAKVILKHYKRTKRREGAFGMRWARDIVSAIVKKLGPSNYSLINPWFYV